MGRLSGVLVQQVSAGLSDGWEDVLRQPVLERLRLRRVGAHQEAVETCLADHVRHTGASKHFPHTHGLSVGRFRQEHLLVGIEPYHV